MGIEQTPIWEQSDLSNSCKSLDKTEDLELKLSTGYFIL